MFGNSTVAFFYYKVSPKKAMWLCSELHTFKLPKYVQLLHKVRIVSLSKHTTGTHYFVIILRLKF